MTKSEILEELKTFTVKELKWALKELTNARNGGSTKSSSSSHKNSVKKSSTKKNKTTKASSKKGHAKGKPTTRSSSSSSSTSKKPLVILSGGSGRARFAKNMNRQQILDALREALPNMEFTTGNRKGANIMLIADDAEDPSPTKGERNPDAEVIHFTEFLHAYNLVMRDDGEIVEA